MKFFHLYHQSGQATIIVREENEVKFSLKRSNRAVKIEHSRWMTRISSPGNSRAFCSHSPRNFVTQTFSTRATIHIPEILPPSRISSVRICMAGFWFGRRVNERGQGTKRNQRVSERPGRGTSEGWRINEIRGCLRERRANGTLPAREIELNSAINSHANSLRIIFYDVHSITNYRFDHLARRRRIVCHVISW